MTEENAELVSINCEHGTPLFEEVVEIIGFLDKNLRPLKNTGAQVTANLAVALATYAGFCTGELIVAGIITEASLEELAEAARKNFIEGTSAAKTAATMAAMQQKGGSVVQ